MRHPKIITAKYKRDYVSRQFIEETGYKAPDLNNPVTFNEKLQWLKLYYRNPLLTLCADKYRVRDYVKEVVGEEYLIEMIDHYESVDEIDFDRLSNQFVLKTNNSSGTNIICTDKNKLDIAEAKQRLKTWMRPEANHYFFGFEWAYKNIKPHIICEKYVGDIGKNTMNYKFFCFNGKPEMILASSTDINKMGTRHDSFDTSWKKLNIQRSEFIGHDKAVKAPKSLKAMLEASKKLSKPFPFVRVDFYEIDGKPKFGELTFYPANGTGTFKNLKDDEKLGNMLKLPKNNARYSIPFEINPEKGSFAEIARQLVPPRIKRLIRAVIK